MKPENTLKIILKLIDRDVKLIRKLGPETQLDHQSAQTLCRYATTLAGIKELREKDLVKEKKRLDSHSTEELAKMLLSGEGVNK